MITKQVRKIVSIDEEKCDGFGLCVPSCHEGAIQIIGGKARLVADKLCDGIGDCLGECPRGAITIEEREADDYDEQAVAEHLGQQQAVPAASPCSGGGCPSAAAMKIGAPAAAPAASVRQRSELQNWPVQLTLVPPHAPWLNGADLLISADCVPYALGSFHSDLLAGKQVITACPKLDDVGPYLDKLTQIFRERDIQRITVARMEVPCCSGLVALVKQALAESGRRIPFEERVIHIGG